MWMMSRNSLSPFLTRVHFKHLSRVRIQHFFQKHAKHNSAFCFIHRYAILLDRKYTPKAVVIDNHLPRQPLISSYVPDWPLPPRVYIPSESEMALRARIYAYNRHLSFDVAFICSTLTHCGVCHLSVWRLKWEVSYVHQSVWRWNWFFCQSNYVLQRLRLCRTSDTVFRREIDSRRQWGYGTCYGGIVSPLRRSVDRKRHPGMRSVSDTSAYDLQLAWSWTSPSRKWRALHQPLGPNLLNIFIITMPLTLDLRRESKSYLRRSNELKCACDFEKIES